RIARGSGIAGLSGVRETNGRIIRPLLGFTKKELVAYCAAHGVVPCDDPSNSNTDFDRVQFRNWLASAPPRSMPAGRHAPLPRCRARI
ncbi:MAG: ATP-binding protein, partial [Sphingomonadales bacterium]